MFVMMDRAENRGFTSWNYSLRRGHAECWLAKHRNDIEKSMYCCGRGYAVCAPDVSNLAYLWKLFVGCTGG